TRLARTRSLRGMHWFPSLAAELAWIPTVPEFANKIAKILHSCNCGDVSFPLYTTPGRGARMRLTEDQPEPLAAQPWHHFIRLIEPGRQQQWVVGTLLEPRGDSFLGDRDFRRGVDEIAEEMPRLRNLVSIPDANRQQAIQTAGHERQLQIAVDLHGNRRRESIHVEEIDPVLDVILDEHPLSIPTDEMGSGSAELIGQEQGRFLVPQFGDGQLTERAVVVVQGDPLVQDARSLVRPGGALQFD